MTSHDAVAVIAGSGSGLGRATAHRLHRQGRTVVLLDLPNSQGEAAAATLGERAHFVAADVTDPGQVRQAFAYAAEHGLVRAAVNCAGVATPGRILSKRGVLPAEDFRRVVEINLLGTFRVLSAAAVVMADNAPDNGDRGAIVCTASIAA